MFKVKTGVDGSVERFKARLVAQGCSQKFGVDYDETFCPVVRFESLRMMVALAVQNQLQLHQMDVTTAFLNGELKEEVYMKQPEQFVEKGKEQLVCKLKRSIYGLKQSPRCWNSVLDGHKRIGFVQANSDPCIYTASEGEMFIVGVYVDDILLACGREERIKYVKKSLAERFEVKDLGRLHYFLGMKVIQEGRIVWIGQPNYTKKVAERFGLQDAKPVSTPIEPGAKLVKAKDKQNLVDQWMYQSAVGSLLYLSVATRPDITYAVCKVARFSAEPDKSHWAAVKRIIRYLVGTAEFGLLYRKGVQEECVGYSDADWGGDLDDRRSTSGYLFRMCAAAVSWRSKKQTCVALLTAEAEYMALASATQEAVWIGQLNRELSGVRDNEVSETVVFEDNQSAIFMAKNPQFHGRTKHIAIKYHFVREQVSNGTVNLKYCQTKEMIADILTKGLSRDQFERLRYKSGVQKFPGTFDF